MIYVMNTTVQRPFAFPRSPAGRMRPAIWDSKGTCPFGGGSQGAAPPERLPVPPKRTPPRTVPGPVRG